MSQEKARTTHQRKTALRNAMPFVFLIVAAVAICLVSAVLVIRIFQGERREPFVVDVRGATVSTLVELDGEEAFPEAITVGPDGFLYSGSFCTGEIWRISPEGDLETWLRPNNGVDSVSGMAFDFDGVLYVVDHGDCDPRLSSSSLKRVAPDGTVEEFAAPDEDLILNGLAFDAEGRLYATETQGGDVRRYAADGTSSVWWEVPADPNKAEPTGITYDADHNALIVADSRNGIIYRVAIQADGTPGMVIELHNDSTHAYDGLTLDDQGRLIFTSYDNHQVMRLEIGQAPIILAKQFRSPSDVAFLDGRVYVTNFDGFSLAPLVSLILDPSLPFTIDVIDLSNETSTQN